MYDFDASVAELERFLGTEAKAQSTFSEAGDQLPPTEAPLDVTLMEVRIATESVTRGRTRVERAQPKHIRVLRLRGSAFSWHVREEGYEGAWWLEPNRQLKVSAGVGAFVLSVANSLPKAPYEYELERVQPDGTPLAVTPHIHKRPLVVGERFLREDGPWLVEEIDRDATPARVRCRRAW